MADEATRNPVSDYFIPITSVVIDEDEVTRVVQTLRSGKLREGEVCRAFEERFAQQVGARHAVAVSSGTAALHLAYMTLIEPGDEVLIPAFTFIATASVAALMGARPVFCDVDPWTFTLDVDDARKRVTNSTAAVAPVHLFGNPCDVRAVSAFAHEFELRVVWDAAQAHGARFSGKDIGREKDVVCYSFYPSKNMTTGEGGMITTNDDELDARCRLLRSHGQIAKYEFSTLGFNYRLTDVMAALGLAQLEKLPRWVERRRGLAERMTRALEHVDGVQPPREQRDGSSSYNLYSVLLDLDRFACDRDEFVRRLQNENIGAAVHYPRPLHKQVALRAFAEDDSLPVAEDLSRRILSLPLHPRLTDREIDLIVEGLTRVADDVRA